MRRKFAEACSVARCWKRLSKGGRACTVRQRHAAQDCERLFQQVNGGTVVRALDWTRERVDGGGAWREPDWIGIDGAERALWMVRVEVGRLGYEVLRRFVGEGESLTGIALDFERDDTAKMNGGCSVRTRDHVSRLLAHALDGAADVLFSDAHADGYKAMRAVCAVREGRLRYAQQREIQRRKALD